MIAAGRQYAVYAGGMPTRRIFELMIVTGILLWPARKTVHTWGKKQLAEHQMGQTLHGVGEVIVSIL